MSLRAAPLKSPFTRAFHSPKWPKRIGGWKGERRRGRRCCCRSSYLRFHPILDTQPAHARKLAHIVCHNGRVDAERMTCNERIQRPDRSTSRFERGANLTVALRRQVIERE